MATLDTETVTSHVLTLTDEELTALAALVYRGTASSTVRDLGLDDVSRLLAGRASDTYPRWTFENLAYVVEPEDVDYF